ncbi:MAG: hypothetical protein HC844_16640 [Tabrizicola sp.]|nr:hypothetical protein [Tabrizicola sp.]
MQQAFALCRDRFGADPPWSFASLLDGNTPARRLLTSGLPGFPRLTAVGRFRTVVMRSLRPGVMPDIRPAAPQDMPQVVTFQASPQRPLAPVLDADDIALGRWPGLAPQDFLLAERAGRLVGLVALWDQRQFRQLRVTDYRRPIRAVSTAAERTGASDGLPASAAPGR